MAGGVPVQLVQNNRNADREGGTIGSVCLERESTSEEYGQSGGLVTNVGTCVVANVAQGWVACTASPGRDSSAVAWHAHNSEPPGFLRISETYTSAGRHMPRTWLAHSNAQTASDAPASGLHVPPCMAE